MTEQELIERMVDDLADSEWITSDYDRSRARKMLTALRESIPGLDALIAGTGVVVPREPTEAMIYAMHHQINWCRNQQNTFSPRHPSQTSRGVGTTCATDIKDAYRAMIEAAKGTRHD